jgi:hypothetical protein
LAQNGILGSEDALYRITQLDTFWAMRTMLLLLASDRSREQRNPSAILVRNLTVVYLSTFWKGTRNKTLEYFTHV